MGFSRQVCWSGLPFPSPGDLPDPGIKPRSPALQADALPFEPPGKPPNSPLVETECWDFFSVVLPLTLFADSSPSCSLSSGCTQGYRLTMSHTVYPPPHWRPYPGIDWKRDLLSLGSQLPLLEGYFEEANERSFPGGASGKEPACQCRRHKTWVWSLGQEDPLEEGMTTHSSILAGRIPWTEEPGGLQSMGSHRVGHDWSDRAHTHNERSRARESYQVGCKKKQMLTSKPCPWITEVFIKHLLNDNWGKAGEGSRGWWLIADDKDLLSNLWEAHH